MAEIDGSAPRAQIPADLEKWIMRGYPATLLISGLGTVLLGVSFFAKADSGRDAFAKLGSLLLFWGLLGVFSLRSVECAMTPVSNHDPKGPELTTKKTEMIANTAMNAILLGMAFIVLQRYTSTSCDGKAMAVLGMWGGACLLMGVLTGFLFGIPKNLESSQLEQISDWITKIIVGVGLTQLSKIPHKLHVWAGVISTQAGGGGCSPSVSFILALILYFMTVGFLAGYLLTKLFLGDGQPDTKQVIERGAVGVSVTGSTGPVTVDTQPASPDMVGSPANAAVSVGTPETIVQVPPPVNPANGGDPKS